MEGREKLKMRIARLDDNAKIWEIIEGYIVDDYNQMSMFNKLVDLFEGDKAKAEVICWEVHEAEMEEVA